jgi:hypothetical protein
MAKSAPQTVRNPDLNTDEVLPAGWQELGEARGLADDQIFASWRKFKAVSRYPFELKRWRGWIAREVVPISKRTKSAR